MRSIKAVLGKLKKPNFALLVIAYILTLVFVTAALLMLFVDFQTSMLLSVIAYAVFGAAGLSLGYTVYTLIICYPQIKSSAVSFLEANPFASKLIGNFGFRTVVAAALSFIGSTAYAVFNGVLGIMFSSVWYGALAAYYILLSLTRGNLLLSQKSKGSESKDERLLLQAKKYRNSGIFLLILNIALSSAIAQMIFDDRAFVYPGWIIYAFAAYAFFKMGMSVYNLLRARQQDDLIVMGIRDINLVDAVVSILALQTALLHAFSTEEISISAFNTVTGIFVSLFSVAFSIYMIIKARKIISAVAKSDGMEDLDGR